MAERQKFIVLRDEELKTAQIIRSEAEAEAAKLINDSVKNYGSTQIEIKKLEAARNIAELLSKNPNISFVPGGSTGNLLNLRVWSLNVLFSYIIRYSSYSYRRTSISNIFHKKRRFYLWKFKKIV